MASLEMLSGSSKKEYAKEAQAVADAPDDATDDAPDDAMDDAPAPNGAGTDSDLEAVVAM